MNARYVIGIHIDREPRVTCERYYTPRDLGMGRIKRFTILGENCAFEKWLRQSHGHTIELPIKVPHYSPQALVECVEGRRGCGRVAEVYKLRPLARQIGARRALLLVYSTASWSNDPYTRYVKSYTKFIIQNLQELLFIF